MFPKKSFAIAILAVITVCASAQEFKKFRIGPTVGLNFASNSAKDVKPKVGFSIGALGEYNFTNNFYMTSALKFSLRNSKFSRGSYSPCYLEVPIHVGYRYSFNEKFSVFGEFGPYIGIGICGKAYEDNVLVEKEVITGLYAETVYEYRDITMDYFGDFKNLSVLGANRFDFGLGLAAGVEFARFQVRLGYDLGLTKIFDAEGSARNRNLYVAFSYMF